MSRERALGIAQQEYAVYARLMHLPATATVVDVRRHPTEPLTVVVEMDGAPTWKIMGRTAVLISAEFPK